MKGLIAIVLLILSMNAGFGFIFGGSGRWQTGFSYTHNRPALTNLFNQRISSIQEYRRPLNIKYVGGLLNAIGLNHRGQVATMANGDRYLIHKGNNFGINSQTVVVKANQMSNKWRPWGQINRPGSQSVKLGDLVRAGGAWYNPVFNNCIHAANRMCHAVRLGK